MRKVTLFVLLGSFFVCMSVDADELSSQEVAGELIRPEIIVTAPVSLQNTAKITVLLSCSRHSGIAPIWQYYYTRNEDNSRGNAPCRNDIIEESLITGEVLLEFGVSIDGGSYDNYSVRSVDGVPEVLYVMGDRGWLPAYVLKYPTGGQDLMVKIMDRKNNETVFLKVSGGRCDELLEEGWKSEIIYVEAD